jgi:hypothetical protein
MEGPLFWIEKSSNIDTFATKISSDGASQRNILGIDPFLSREFRRNALAPSEKALHVHFPLRRE